MNLTEIWDAVTPILTNSWTMTVAGAVLGGIFGAVVPRYLTRAFDRATGLTEVRDNAGSILGQAANYHLFSPKHQRAKAVSLTGDLPESIGSAMEIDPGLGSVTLETAGELYFVMRDDQQGNTWKIFTLDLTDEDDSALYLACSAHPLEPEKIREILTKRNAAASPEQAQEVCRAVALRGKTPKRLSWASRAQAGDGSATTVDQAMKATLLALISSSEREINLSRRCHLAAKYTDADKAHICIRILTQAERKIASSVIANGDFARTTRPDCGREALENAAALPAKIKERAAEPANIHEIMPPH